MRNALIIGHAFVLLSLPAWLAGCAMPSADKPASGPAQPTADASTQTGTQGIEGRIGELSPRQLADGACGIFLWSREARPRLVFFSDNQAPGAAMVLDEVEVTLRRTRADGQIFFGQFESQGFVHDDLTVGLAFEVEAKGNLIGGAVVPRGTLTLSDGDGWQMVQPVAGMLACARN